MVERISQRIYKLSLTIMAIIKKDRNWDILFDQIVKGNVIPVIGPEPVRVDKSSSQVIQVSITYRGLGS